MLRKHACVYLYLWCCVIYSSRRYISTQTTTLIMFCLALRELGTHAICTQHTINKTRIPDSHYAFPDLLSYPHNIFLNCQELWGCVDNALNSWFWNGAYNKHYWNFGMLRNAEQNSFKRGKNKNKSHLSVILWEIKQANRMLGIRGCYMTNVFLLDLSALFSGMATFIKYVIRLFSLHLSCSIKKNK